MNPESLNEQKEKSIPIAGVILSCLFTIRVLFLTPVLLIIFIIQAVRRRKNKKYIRNCVFSALWCFMMVLAGPLISSVSPVSEGLITEVKIQTYESTVEKIHNGEQIQKYEDMTGGIKGSEDVAFFQYSPGEHEEDNHTYYLTEYYILYSADSSCDVERIKEHARGLPLYQHGRIEMEEIKSNWYRLEVTYSLNS